ncbi:glycosyltransferase [Lutibacter sp.]
MKILWFTNTPSLYDQGKHGYHGGGWIESLETLIHQQKYIELAVSFLHKTDGGKKEISNKKYYPIKRISAKKNPFKTILNNYKGDIEGTTFYIPYLMDVINDFKPDVIHIFGTEGVFASIQPLTNIPVVIHLQGIINPYLNTYYTPNLNKTSFLFSTLYFLKNLIGSSPAFGYRKFSNQAKREREFFQHTHFLMGRTKWDKSVSNLLAPQAKYFHIDEVLRPIFYNNKKENYTKGQPIKIISTLSPTIYKGLDMILKTAKLINETTNIAFEWSIAGLNTDDILLKHFEKIFKISHKKQHITCLGKVAPEKLTDLLKTSDIFVHPSYIDNSPNSVCEAQIVGLPVFACNVGGVATIIEDNKTGILVPSNGVYELAFLIKDYSNNPNKYFLLGKNARDKALIRHNRDTIVEDLLNVYDKVVK